MRAKPLKNSRKVHAAMQPDEMRKLRNEMMFSLKDLSVVLQIPYRTLQDYEYGKRGIPPYFAELIIVEAANMRMLREVLYQNIDQRVAEEYPHGFPSEVEGE